MQPSLLHDGANRSLTVHCTTGAIKNQCVETAVFGFADSLFILISLDALVIILCIFYDLRAALFVSVGNLHIEENAIKAGAPQTVRLKFWLYLDIVANVIHQVCKHVSDSDVS